ncbi:MAG: DUF4160 domain-containing protein [Methylocystis sp.]|nr:DUF4160 domain-containing protein [Methylocystis sp.]MBI3274492.1 DUF4160 domain-containing protein [Methylocystis sp.]
MPEIVRLKRCRICVYPGDHRPPHFHVRGSGWRVAVDLVTFQVRGRGEKLAIEEAIAWARAPDNGFRLAHEWRRLNERE